METICFSNKCKFSDFKPSVYYWLDECIPSSVEFLIRDY